MLISTAGEGANTAAIRCMLRLWHNICRECPQTVCPLWPGGTEHHSLSLQHESHRLSFKAFILGWLWRIFTFKSLVLLEKYPESLYDFSTVIFGQNHPSSILTPSCSLSTST
jgi:hypothetical protein